MAAVKALETIGKSGLMTSVMNALRWTGLSATCARPALRALTCLCRNGECAAWRGRAAQAWSVHVVVPHTCGAAENNKGVVCASGGMGLVVRALNLHGADADVALAGCGVVVNTSSAGMACRRSFWCCSMAMCGLTRAVGDATRTRANGTRRPRRV